MVFTVLRDNKLYVNLKKCTFMVDHLVFLGFVIGADGIQVDEGKVQAMRDWPTPTLVKDFSLFCLLLACLILNYTV